MTRVYGIAPDHPLDPEYGEGLRTAVRAALDYALDSLEPGEDRLLPPPSLLAQARLAARHSIGIDTVLRRYYAGQALFSDYLIEEAMTLRAPHHGWVQRLLRSQAGLFDRLLAAVSEQHADETRRCSRRTADQRLVEQIERQLEGELIDTSGISYDFGGHHTGLIATGEDTENQIRRLVAKLDCNLLTVSPRADITWAWLGGRRNLERTAITDTRIPDRMRLAVGTPVTGIGGWRLTHRQAKTALPLARVGSGAPVFYADVTLIASVFNDEVLTQSLREQFIEPLRDPKRADGSLLSTLRAYFATGRNISSAAAILGVSRQAVARRLRIAEQKLERELTACSLDLEAALRLEELAQSP